MYTVAYGLWLCLYGSGSRGIVGVGVYDPIPPNTTPLNPKSTTSPEANGTPAQQPMTEKFSKSFLSCIASGEGGRRFIDSAHGAQALGV